MQNNLSWKFTTSINDTRTLFENEVLPYTIDAYICTCSHKEFIIRLDIQETKKYSCTICENENFLDANHYLGNVVWYESIEETFSKELLYSADLRITQNTTSNKLFATIVLIIPNSIDLSCDEISYLEKEMFQISIDNYGEIEERLFTDFNLKKYDTDASYYSYYPTQEEFTNEHSIFLSCKERISQEIAKNRYFDLSADIYTKVNNIEHIRFFLKNSNLKEFDFYYWKAIYYLPAENASTIYEVLSYIQNYRKEKSLKKAIYDNYKDQMKDESYCFIYPYGIAKYIKDVNIAKRLLKFDFTKYFKEIVDRNSLEYFLQYLTKHFSDKQIENLFKSYKTQEMFWFIDTLEQFAELHNTMREEFVKVSCKYNILHDEITQYHRLTMEQGLLDTKFSYMQKQLDACVEIESYEVKLPLDGSELYEWSNTLSNCLAGYGEPIKKYKTTVYGFFKDKELLFAVEIQNNKIIQARTKYNVELPQDEMDVVIAWHEEFILETKYENISTIN